MEQQALWQMDSLSLVVFVIAQDFAIGLQRLLQARLDDQRVPGSLFVSAAGVGRGVGASCAFLGGFCWRWPRRFRAIVSEGLLQARLPANGVQKSMVSASKSPRRGKSCST